MSYRTNRWFAKPRWVEIELTYTQAVKLGLAEARARIPESAEEIVTDKTASPTQTEVACTNTTRTAPSPNGDDALSEGEAAKLRLDLIGQVEVLSEQAAADDFQLAADQEVPEAKPEDPLPRGVKPAFHGEASVPTAAATARIDNGTRSVRPIGAQWPHPVTTPRRNVRPVVTWLAAAIACIMLWSIFDTASLRPGPKCARAEPPERCSTWIVTGSIGPNSAAQIPASAPIEDPTPPIAEVAPIDGADIGSRNIATSLSGPLVDENLVTRLPSDASQDVRAVILAPSEITVPQRPVFVESAVPTPQQPVTPSAECASLGDISRRLLITFDYARDRLDPAVFSALDGFAAKLQACPDRKVIIEGHTDSDGHTDRNRYLSLWRAQAVQQRLVAAGVDPDQLESVGFGDTRPAVPNDTQQNKRSNRRAALAVTER